MNAERHTCILDDGGTPNRRCDLCEAEKQSRQRPKIVVIDLNPHDVECHLCDRPCHYRQGVPIYEGAIVPDDHQGEWGGVPVCLRCYYLVRGLQSEHPGKLIPFAAIRGLLGDAPPSGG
jgi:hypothetical protein